MPGRIPQSFIDDLIAHTDIVDVIDAVHPLRKAGKNHLALCPFHDEKTPSFTVSREKQFFHCFGCGASGTAITFLMEFHKVGFVEAIEDLAARAGVEVPREGGRGAGESGAKELYELMESSVRYYAKQLRENRRAVEYLKLRGISDATVDRFELGYAPPGWNNLLGALGKSEAAQEQLLAAGMIVRREGGGYYDRFRDRLMFPIRDRRGRPVGFGGRVIDQGTPKYLNSPETPIFHKGRELYGLHGARSASLDRLYVVEGYMDVLALNQFGIDCAVATLGTAATRDHMERLFRSTSRLVFCFDGDDAGRRAAWRALEIALPFLSDGRQVFFLFMPEGQDPDTWVRAVGRERFENPDAHVALSDHLIETLAARERLTSREGRAAFVGAALPYLRQLPDGALKQLLVQDVATRAAMDVDAVRAQLASGSPRPIRGRPGGRAGAEGGAGRTLLGGIVRLLVGHPRLGALVPDSRDLRDTTLPGSDFLAELLDFINSNPHVSTAGILEHWRDTRYEARLRSLARAAEDLAVDELDPEREFLEAMDQLRSLIQRLRRRELAGVGRLSELSDEGRELIRALREPAPPGGKK